MNSAVLSHKQALTSSPDLLALLRQYQLMPQLLQCLVIDRAIDPFTVTNSERDSALAEFYQQYQLDDSAAIETWLQLNHLGKDELESVVLRPLRIEKFKLKTWGSKLESYFLKRKSSLDRVIYSLIRTTDRWIAQELFFRLQDNEQSFEELAQQFSDSSSTAIARIRSILNSHRTHLRSLLAIFVRVAALPNR